MNKSSIAFGYRSRTVRNRLFSGRASVRLLTVSAVLFLVAVGLAAVALTHGDYPLTLQQVFATLFGGERGFEWTIVAGWRLPIAIAAVVFGALLGIGGAIFQSLTRNPLGAPDVIGFDAGAYTAVVVTILVIDTRSYWYMASAALIGGMGTAFVVYVLSYRRGIQGFRMIIVGIGVAAMLASVNTYLVSRAELDDALSVGYWGAGSIARVTWAPMIPALVIAAAIVVSAVLLAPAMRRLELGDDAAVTLGTRPGAARLGLIVTGVATVAVVTAAAGPISFIALAAPQVARRLTRSPGVSLLASAAMGAALLSGAHLLSLLIAQAYRPVPVGLITVCLGGGYLIWLLIRETQQRYGLAR
ncbi:iron chelate uptake ABC transporter family permease subunit [Actinocorallia sp. API 0066]|uniref:FecCD family ABC transporter permease n=1 Tax=Actinocorallia sp. API 0066 TaxID=2896846 RepID=UPI001E2BF6A0|nr:iron chelate uptake ABC transporter family permease subunit [Actinocorallia sp. API 0066]MCD0449090.1 iron chelate uptake ABC transporter family permease subunit [Actinocorallia sp. API 0066]